MSAQTEQRSVLAAAKGPFWLLELWTLLVQIVTFLAGLVVSLAVGMALAKVCDGPAGLIVATVAAAAGLLGAATASQLLRDYLIERAA